MMTFFFKFFSFVKIQKKKSYLNFSKNIKTIAEIKIFQPSLAWKVMNKCNK